MTTHLLPGSHGAPDTRFRSAAGTQDDPPAMGTMATSTVSLAGSSLSPAMNTPAPIGPAPVTPQPLPAMDRSTPISEPPAGSNPLSARGVTEPNQATPTGPTSPLTMNEARPMSAASAGNEAAQPAKDQTEPNSAPLAGPILADPVLGIHADTVDEVEQLRISASNRLRQLTDPGEHGHGLTAANPEVRRLAAMVEQFEKLEHQAVLNLQRAMRNHPLGVWVKRTPGVGEKQAARLLAAIRDPYWNDLHQRPRLVSELWSYSGMHVIETSDGQSGSENQKSHAVGGHPGSQSTPDNQCPPAAGVAPTRKRGQRANWNAQARQRVWLIAESCIKVRHSPYRDVYDNARLKYADAVHEVPCVRCGPSGSPAQPGSPLSAGHQHGRAMRAMCKQILQDLWREARNLHHPTDNEGGDDVGP